MITLQIYVITIILSFLAIKWNQSKVFPIFFMICGWLAITCISNAADVLAMENRYMSQYFIGFPVIFRQMMLILSRSRITFLEFRAIYAIIVVGAIYLFYRRNTEYMTLAYLLYFIYPLICYVGQIRSGMSSIIVLFDIMYFIKSDSRYKKIVYIIFIIIASMIHPSAICYSIAILCDKKIKNAQYLVLLIFGLLYTNGIYYILSIFIHDDRVLQYTMFKMTPNFWGSVLAVMGQLAWTIIINYSGTLLRKERCNGEKKFLNYDQVTMIVRLNNWLMLLMPFYAISHMIFRIYKYILIINYLVLVQAVFRNKQKDIVLLTLILMLTIMTFMGQAFVDLNVDGFWTVLNGFDISCLKYFFGTTYG